MNGRVEPALTPEEWERIKADLPIMRISLVDDVRILDDRDLVAVIANANDALSDADTRKLTRKRVLFLFGLAAVLRRFRMDADAAELEEHAEQLGAFLPSEGT